LLTCVEFWRIEKSIDSDYGITVVVWIESHGFLVCPSPRFGFEPKNAFLILENPENERAYHPTRIYGRIR